MTINPVTMNEYSIHRNTMFHRFLQHRWAVTGAFLLVFITLFAILYPEFTCVQVGDQLERTDYAFRHINLETEQKNQAPSAEHPFGTDALGRDVLERVIYGGRISISIGFFAALISLTLGLFYGLIAGFFGGVLDTAMMRIVDMLYGLPFILLVSLFMVVTEERSISKLFIALGIIQWLTIARITRSRVLSLKEMDFIKAAQAMGASSVRIILVHLLPNTLGIALVYTSLTIPTIILEEAFLSFLGLGVPADQCSWGSLLAEGAKSLLGLRIFWWQLVFPSLFMMITILSFNFLGDGLRDALDPKIKRA